MKATVSMTVGEPPPCLQCRHDRHCSIMLCHATTWEQDHSDNHTRTYADARIIQPSLQAKLTSFPFLGSRPLGWENPSLHVTLASGLYIRATMLPFQGDGLLRLHSDCLSPLSYLLHPSLHTLL